MSRSELPTPDSVADEINRDFNLLDAAELGGPTIFRTWRSPQTTVVLGLSRNRQLEVDDEACSHLGISVLRRASGGGTVVVGAGTLQYTFVLPYRLSPELAGIQESKALCNRLLIDALPAACPTLVKRASILTRKHTLPLVADPSGDLIWESKKIAGVALKRKKNAMLLHGTLLETADLQLIESVLRHPIDEPTYRLGRAHCDFLANVGNVDAQSLEETIRGALARL
ncbi:MAG: lipoate-protein ligase A [Hyphomicrobiaceae bacterium]|jgi:lipoate-protein ligase A